MIVCTGFRSLGLCNLYVLTEKHPSINNACNSPGCVCTLNMCRTLLCKYFINANRAEHAHYMGSYHTNTTITTPEPGYQAITCCASISPDSALGRLNRTDAIGVYFYLQPSFLVCCPAVRYRTSVHILIIFQYPRCDKTNENETTPSTQK